MLKTKKTKQMLKTKKNKTDAQNKISAINIKTTGGLHLKQLVLVVVTVAF